VIVMVVHPSDYSRYAQNPIPNNHRSEDAENRGWMSGRVRRRRRTAATGPDPSEAAHWAAELSWWRSRCDVREALDDGELRRSAALHTTPRPGRRRRRQHPRVRVRVAQVQKPVAPAAHADAQRLRAPAEARATGHR
jgi:hypothetical protein